MKSSADRLCDVVAGFLLPSADSGPATVDLGFALPLRESAPASVDDGLALMTGAFDVTLNGMDLARLHGSDDRHEFHPIARSANDSKRSGIFGYEAHAAGFRRLS
ncbi:hypothetical protein [Paraburkholderia sp. ZP32-5]|uniref:hypothetical protein n=1 Tax=Paraburkholderia sp. ZP32-5 TaxID=2883245 RepID=UPI001F3EE4A1|nr:hypothetical protein [Paraburkholderia sp. ZP32-5]